MAIEKINIDTLYGRIDSFKDQIKEYNGLIKEAFETFAEQNGLSKDEAKSLKKAYKAKCDLEKDRAKFETMENTYNTIVDLLTTEITTTEIEEE